MALLVHVFGWSGRGKTRAAEAVVRCLSARGLRVFGVKHSSHPEDLREPEGKDGWRMAAAGAAGVVLTSEGVTRIVLGEGLDLGRAVGLAESLGAEAVVVEGFKSEVGLLGGSLGLIAAGSPEEVEDIVDDPGTLFGVYCLSGGGTWVVGGVRLRVYGPGEEDLLCSDLLGAARVEVG